MGGRGIKTIIAPFRIKSWTVLRNCIYAIKHKEHKELEIKSITSKAYTNSIVWPQMDILLNLIMK